MKTYSDFNEISSQNEQRKNQILKGFSDSLISDNNIQKAHGGGEGSKGGKVIGHTKSGKPIYADKEGDHKVYKDFNDQDHDDAMMAHFKHAYDNRKDEKVAKKHYDISHGHMQMKSEENDIKGKEKVEKPDINPAGE